MDGIRSIILPLIHVPSKKLQLIDFITFQNLLNFPFRDGKQPKNNIWTVCTTVNRKLLGRSECVYSSDVELPKLI